MNTPQPNKRRRDWSLIVFILPIGVVMMLCVGQLAIRMAPRWAVEGEMKSFLDPEVSAKEDAMVVPPVSNDILTPMSWWDTFLTPSGDSDGSAVFPPFVIFEPTSTPTATATSTTSSLPTSTTSATSTPPAPTTTPTKKPTIDNPTASATTPSASPTTPSPSPTTPSPSPTTPSPSPTTPSPTTPAPITSMPQGTLITPPPDVNVGLPDDKVESISNGTYFVLYLDGTPLFVNGPSDTNYDLVYYEWLNPSPTIYLDTVIVGITNDPTGASFYIVFHWGDNQPDTNSNIDYNNLTSAPNGCTDLECDNQSIDTSNLTPTAPAFGGILIDVDNAASAPPIGTYEYIVIQAPPADTDGGTDIDSVQITEVPAAPTP